MWRPETKTPRTAAGTRHTGTRRGMLAAAVLLAMFHPARGAVRQRPLLPLLFVPNRGQVAAPVRFLAKGTGVSAYFTPGEVVLELPLARVRARHRATSALRLRFVGGNTEPAVEGLEPESGRANFFLGGDPARWRTDLPTYRAVAYRGLYRGIDLLYRADVGRLKAEFRLAPGADPGQIRLAYAGAERIKLSDGGAIVIKAPAGALREAKPVIYQDSANGQRTPVSGGFALGDDGTVTITVGTFDPSRSLVIDPTLVFSTHLGGSNLDAGDGVAVDSTGVYIVGSTRSTDFPLIGGVQQSFGGTGLSGDAFITKLTKDGSSPVYSTYLGGAGNDAALSVAVDGAGNAYVAGSTTSTDFPTVNPLQASNAGGADVFVAKLNAAGDQLLYSTYLGGSAGDFALCVAIDSTGSAYVGGATQSATDFPTSAALQPIFGGGLEDGFVAKIAPAGTSLSFSTYLGGSGNEGIYGLALDSANAIYVAGQTSSTDFPTVNPIQASLGGPDDAFVTKLSADGSSLAYSTYLGGSDEENGDGIAVDGAGNAYVAGGTTSSDFPGTLITQPAAVAPASPASAPTNAFGPFITKLDAAGNNLIYSTVVSGGGIAEAVAVDAAGHAFIVGLAIDIAQVRQLELPRGNGFDAFVTKLDTAGASLLYSTPVGGSGFGDAAFAVALDATGADAYVTGYTDSSDFPARHAMQAHLRGSQDAFVFRIRDTCNAGTPFVLAVTEAKITAATSPAANNARMSLKGEFCDTASAPNDFGTEAPAGLHLRAQDGLAFDQTFVFPSGACTPPSAGGTIRCATPDRHFKGVFKPAETGPTVYRFRLIARSFTASGPFQGPVTVTLSRDASASSGQGRIDICTNKQKGLSCKEH